jgi:hypothetical protein
VTAALRHGGEFLAQHPSGVCWYVTDGRCSLKSQKAREELDKFKQSEGIPLFLDQKQAIDWYSLAALRDKLDNGDITLFSSSGEERVAGEDDLALYLKNGFDRNLLENASSDGRNESGGAETNTREGNFFINEEILADKISSIIRTSSMRIMDATMLLGHLQKNGENATYEQLLKFIRARADKFFLHQADNGGFIVRLK